MSYAIHMYFDGLSLRKTSKALSRLVKRSHTAIRDWIQKYHPQRISLKKRMISEYIIDETLIKARSDYKWLWIEIEPKNKQILALSIFIERNMFVAEKFISGLVKIYGKHMVSTDGGTWYPQAYMFLDLITTSILIMRIVWLKGLCNTLRTELKDLMIIFHVEKRIVN